MGRLAGSRIHHRKRTRPLVVNVQSRHILRWGGMVRDLTYSIMVHELKRGRVYNVAGIVRGIWYVDPLWQVGQRLLDLFLDIVVA